MQPTRSARLTLLTERREPAQLVEEVEDENDLVTPIFGLTSGRYGRGHSLAVRMNVHGPVCWARQDPLRAPGPGHVIPERIPFLGVRHRHDLIVERLIE